jgi:5'-phosphate synthase pdxT subunit
MRVGILGLQGCIEPHERIFRAMGIDTLRVRLPEDLANIDRIILPGGESTTMLSLLLRANLFEPLQFFGKTKPMWGICAGAILMAKEVEHPKQKSLELISLRATRNYYGSQRESFKAAISVEAEVAEGAPLEADFIRAPLLTPLSETTCVLARAGDKPVLFREGHLLASSFHTELGTDTRLHEYFLRLAAGSSLSLSTAPRELAAPPRAA